MPKIQWNDKRIMVIKYCCSLHKQSESIQYFQFLSYYTVTVILKYDILLTGIGFLHEGYQFFLEDFDIASTVQFPIYKSQTSKFVVREVSPHSSTGRIPHLRCDALSTIAFSGSEMNVRHSLGAERIKFAFNR